MRWVQRSASWAGGDCSEQGEGSGGAAGKVEGGGGKLARKTIAKRARSERAGGGLAHRARSRGSACPPGAGEGQAGLGKRQLRTRQRRTRKHQPAGSVRFRGGPQPQAGRPVRWGRCARTPGCCWGGEVRGCGLEQRSAKGQDGERESELDGAGAKAATGRQHGGVCGARQPAAGGSRLQRVAAPVARRCSKEHWGPDPRTSQRGQTRAAKKIWPCWCQPASCSTQPRPQPVAVGQLIFVFVAPNSAVVRRGVVVANSLVALE